MNFLKDITNKDKSKNKYTLRFEEIQNEKEKETKKQNEVIKNNKKGLKNLFKTIIVLATLIASLIVYENYKSENLYSKGKTTSAIITNIVHNNYRVNDMGGTFVNNYQFEYEFTFDKRIINSFYEIRIEEYDKYFKKKARLKDTILIIFNPKSPKENEIIKIK